MISELRLIIDGYDGMIYSSEHVDSVEDARLRSSDCLELDVTIIVVDREGKVVKRIK